MHEAQEGGDEGQDPRPTVAGDQHDQRPDDDDQHGVEDGRENEKRRAHDEGDEALSAHASTILCLLDPDSGPLGPEDEESQEEVPTVGHGDRPNDDPQRGVHYETIGQEGLRYRRRIAGRKMASGSAPAPKERALSQKTAGMCNAPHSAPR